jgi:hypothetical protein
MNRELKEWCEAMKETHPRRNEMVEINDLPDKPQTAEEWKAWAKYYERECHAIQCSVEVIEWDMMRSEIYELQQINEALMRNELGALKEINKLEAEIERLKKANLDP